MVGGRGLKLHASSKVREAVLFIAIDVDAGRRGAHSESQVRLASAIEVDWLDPRLLKEERLIEFDDNSERVHGKRCQRYLDLTLDSVDWSPGPEGRELVAEKLAAAAADSLERALNLDEPQLLSVQRRVALIERAYPDLEFPDFGRSAIVALLPQLCNGRRSFADLKRAPLLDSLLNRLSYEQRQRLDRDAPERLQVPSGSHIVLQYRDDAAPILPVRIQEMFGATATPRIAGGRVTVLLHLLAPNSRPQQVTDDLASFWASTYTEVRKELRRRYPKHAWPDDPESAQAERRPRRKR
jgi:ATP-dependent helicase HrpB